MTFSEPATDIFAALAQAQGEIDNAKKDAKNPAFNKNYADLASVLDVAKAPMAKAGLALTFDTTSAESQVVLQPTLVHKSGQWIKYEPFAVRLTKTDAQGQGSGITYGRRYLIQTILGIAAEDDDGQAASQPSSKTPQKAAEPKKTADQRTDAPAPGVTKASEVPKHPAWVNGGSEIKALFESQIDGHPAFRDEEIAEYRKEYSKIAHVNPEILPARVDKFIGDIKNELLKRSELSEEFAPLTGSVTVEDAADGANPQEIF